MCCESAMLAALKIKRRGALPRRPQAVVASTEAQAVMLVVSDSVSLFSLRE